MLLPNLPPDIIHDILSRLPVKSLCCFKCVSKPWCTLIDDPDFIKLHLKRSIETNTNLSIILRDAYLYSVDFDSLDSAIELDHPLRSPDYGVDLLGSCNGLLCLSNSEETVVLWNPSTRKHHLSPVAEIEFPDTDCFTFCQYIIFGFGYDEINDDYKVVRIIQFYGEDVWDSFENEVKVFSLKQNSWRRIQDFPYYLRYKRSWGILANGALHWVVSRKPESDPSNVIAAFDLASEEYRLVPQPDYLDTNFHMNVDVLRGCLCVLCNYVEVCVDVWMMKDYGVKESWTKLFSISQPQVIRSFEYVLPLAYSKSGSEVLLEQDGKKLVWYDLKANRVKNVRIRGLPGHFEGQICVGSLVPLKGDSGIDDKKQQAGNKKKKKKKQKKKRNNLLELNFPMEVIQNILSRLPVKPLLQFKCVSKPWLTLIDSPDFVKRHLHQSIGNNTNMSIILRYSYLYSVDFDSLDNAIELEHPLKSEFYGTEVLGSCNGLLCLYNSEEDVVLWNLSTKKFHKLPVKEIEFPSYFTICQYVIYGFGHDFVNDDYKVVRIAQFYGKDGEDSFESEVMVYSLKANSWKRIRGFPYYLRYKRGWGHFAGGALHWVVTRSPKSNKNNLIAAFDLGLEEYQQVPQPRFTDNKFHMNLEVLGGCLCILANYHRVRVDVWVMKEYGVKESWTKLFSVAQPKVIRSFEYVRPLAYSKSGNEVLLEQDNKVLLWYDMKKKTVKNVKICGSPNSFEAVVCIGSLVPLNDSAIFLKKPQAQEEKKKKKRDDFLSQGFKLVL